ncbi:uncharacterized protein CANTADRAFT_25704 [Suhomyces tanzawaensis NRRL Y-17324]|uniref:Uncharacterized protein n=1 Tax=Suhomyces tanzawaensis NRRL Y-17324 TaxID=984487 RepID=A0A1E4SK63_9ASCO|nr:uncharacterized protein CANTADRAFT_25704 [Suhomyces tanzawaensis NRRL Y-17324]ODV79899.1 hypothetical protein CANTADRAFT_25704 [Suhomyces tanzawaensis NRRL Y-17324]
MSPPPTPLVPLSRAASGPDPPHPPPSQPTQQHLLPPGADPAHESSAGTLADAPPSALPPIRPLSYISTAPNVRGIGSRLNSLNIISDYYFRHRPHPSHVATLAFHPRSWVPPPDTDLSVNVLPSPLRNVGSSAPEDTQMSEESDLRYSEAELNQSDDEIDISYTELEAQRAIQFIDSIDVAGDSSESELEMPPERPSDIDATERLLLSSARQNTSGSNRLITRLISFNSFDLRNNPTGNGSAVPLQRQNAIRSRTRNSNKCVFYRNGADQQTEDSKNELESTMERIKQNSANLIKDIDQFLHIIRGQKSNHNLFHGGSEELDLVYAFKMTGLEHNFHLEGKMDAFLRLRQSPALWSRKLLGREPEESTSTAKRRYVSQSPFKSNKKRKLASAGPGTETAKFNRESTALTLMHQLSPSEKYRILSVQFSSYFKSGSCFGVRISNEENAYSDLYLTNVDYHRKSIDGVFRVMEDDKFNQIDYWKRLFKHAKFFCGENSLLQDKILGCSALARRLFLLERAEYDLILSLATNTDCKKPMPLNFNIPFRGRIIDFKMNDLRFLSSNSKKNPVNDSYAFTKHLSQTFKYNLANLQLIEWMRLQPFQEYKDCYLEMYAQELKELLENISQEGPKYGLQQTIDLAKEFKSTVHLLTKSYTVDDCCSATASQVDPRHTSDRYYHQNWEKRLSKELLENLTSDGYESLLNVQLNYILFTLKVDLIEFLDNILNCILETFKNQHVNNESKEFRYLMQITQLFDVDNVTNEDILAILLCSMNRKTGKVHIHNTLPYINYKNQSSRRVIGVVDSGVSRYNSSGVPSSFNSAPFNSWLDNEDIRERYMREDRHRFDQERPRVVDPYIDGQNIDMYGYSKQEGALGGGSPSFDVL